MAGASCLNFRIHLPPAIDSTKLRNELGWEPKVRFSDGIKETIKYYLRK